MASELPDELVPIPSLVIVIARIVDHFIVVLFYLTVVLDNCFGYGRHCKSLASGASGKERRMVFAALAQSKRNGAHTEHACVKFGVSIPAEVENAWNEATWSGVFIAHGSYNTQKIYDDHLNLIYDNSYDT